MRSLLVSGLYFPPGFGGIGQLMAETARALGPQRVACLTGVPSGDASDRRLAGGVRVYRRPAVFARSRIRAALGLGLAALELAARERPRILQIALAYEASLGLLASRWLRMPYAIWAHGNEILDVRRSTWQKPLMALRRAHAVIAVSRFTRDLVVEAGIRPDRVAIVHPGCDARTFRPVPGGELRAALVGTGRSFVLLTVGGLVRRKGHDTVLRAMATLHETLPFLRYVVVGDGPMRSELTALAEQLGVAGAVRFVGQVPAAELPAYYAACDAFIMPSRANLPACDVEGFGLVFLEAAACERPSIAGRSGGIADSVVDGESGILADPERWQDVAAAISRLVESPDLGRRLGRQGRERVIAQFSWERVADQVHAVLTAVAGRRPLLPGS
jgi:phosphatidylinositol alpha-1,6-mannosyltransferase